ncbi:uncharacterized protein LOC143330967 isoform X2 [Chaetodon auriga]|uniref:uncharacterized protein LOC143330967 isoform X2 n=1 Tax=Chaetodon auriga TaxID=39042 RepID=UPI00403313F1
MAPRYFLAFLTFTSCTAAIESLKYALKGQEVSLKPDIAANSADILWKHNGNKVVEFDGREELVYGQFESRITLDWHSAELTITDLSFEDSGNYDLEIFRDNKLHYFRYKLEVIENVAKPTISCKMNDDGESGTLACSAEPRQPQSLMKFEWSSHGNVLPGPQLIIPLGQKHDDEEYSCHVSNPLSNETATFTAKHCYPENDPGPVIAGVVSAVILLLGIVVGVVFCRQTRRACFAEDKTENDVKNQSAPGAADAHVVNAEGQMPRKGSDEEAAQGDENAPLLDRAPTLPLGRGSVNMRPNDSASNHKEDTGSHLDAGKAHVVNAEGQMPRKGWVKERVKNIEQNNDEPIVPKNLQTGSDEEAAQGDKTTDLYRAPTPPSNQPLGRELAKKKEETEGAKSLPANAVSPTAQPCSPLTPNSSNTEAKDTAGEHEEDGNSDEISAETCDSSGVGKANKSDDSREDEPSSTIPEEKESVEENSEEPKSCPANAVSPPAQPCSPLTTDSPNTAAKDTAGKHEGDGNSDEISTGKCDSSGVGKANKSDDSSGDKPSSTIPEVKGSETTPHEQETHRGDDEQQKEGKSVTEAVNGTHKISDAEEAKEDPCLASHCDSSSFQESPHTANTDPGQEEENKTRKDSGESAEDENKTRKDSGESAEDENKTRKDSGESAEDEGETAESENEAQCNPGEEKPGQREP